MEIITITQAREHLRSDTNDDDADLHMKIDAATDAVLDYISVPASDLFDADGEPKTGEDGQVVRGARRVQQAILLTVGWFYEDRDGSMEQAVKTGHGYPLPRGATALLYSLRKPTIA
ncbi:head-tail connector protein [Comamonas sp. B21-038]|uniref:head-tail connector protein n=1 Tax=Comamonas sp. B21-038 TaxID=2918299 RepID=UPI001EFC2A82|nr:head-tail connector protein [Comamonas sp. B21-038]ULR87182.1 head-tail connector protein [Comamonas sp. B21-038]